jgi:hypothetical protein
MNQEINQSDILYQTQCHNMLLDLCKLPTFSINDLLEDIKTQDFTFTHFITTKQYEVYGSNEEEGREYENITLFQANLDSIIKYFKGQRIQWIDFKNELLDCNWKIHYDIDTIDFSGDVKEKIERLLSDDVICDIYGQDNIHNFFIQC